jgi:RNA polymerase sigma factor (sigma-70 family)
MDKTLMTDQQLIELVREGDASGLSFVYEKHRREFLSWIRKFSHCSEDESREFYQAAMVILYENTMSGRLTELQSSLKTYLFGIGKNLALQSHRKEGRLQQAKAEYMLQQHVLAEDGDDSLETDLTLISLCFSKIGDPCHHLLDMFYFFKKNMEEIATELGYKNPETAKNQKYKCMERLRKLVEDERANNYLSIEGK